VFVSRHQSAGQSRNKKTANESFENVMKFKHIDAKVKLKSKVVPVFPVTDTTP